MGLDMYLSKETYVGNKYRDADKRVKVTVPRNQEGVFLPTPSIKTKRVKSITEDVGYWRKANHIHKWFVDNVQDNNDNCGEYQVSKEKLRELLDLCIQVRSASRLVDGEVENGQISTPEGLKPNMEKGKYIEDPSVAQELLPTSDGFFFGSSNYDQWYMEDIESTINILETVLKELEESPVSDVYYSSSW